MNASSRHQRILTRLRDRGRVAGRELVRLLAVTPMTVWRDLRLLEEQGLLRRVRGGAEMSSRAAGEPDFEVKAAAANSAKERIAACAARTFIRVGDVVAMEGGTTVATLVGHLPAERVSILTNSLPVALRLRTLRPALPVRIASGWVSPISGNVTGPEALKSIRSQAATLCFLSATAFDAERGPTDPNPLEIEVKRALAAISDRVILLLDSSKFGRRAAAITLHPRRLHAVVTDAPPPADIAALLVRYSVRLIVARK
ncbi:MAG: DeoR/GlpR transcriptional regulator [Opitutaceae bacterium]|nr:DeoR/GlpR transcriptional regulator [Opitutaceae bacterium]